ncbi:MAG TPA: hypothetical protein PL105_23310, partial [Caldilineaceae bacterium]|nr:hypothetical protein [Caldilineaceae bacterium]
MNRALYRDLWGNEKLAQLSREGVDGVAADAYTALQPSVELGYPLIPRVLSADYLSWPKLPELFPQSIPGVQTKRDADLISIDKEPLIERMKKYFDPKVSDREVAEFAPRLMEKSNRFEPQSTRRTLLRRGFLPDHIVRYCFRPFDMRWIYWEPETKLLGEKSPTFFPQVRDENVFIEARKRESSERFDRGYFVRVLADNFGNGFSNFFPLYLYDDDPGQLFQGVRENLSPTARRYLEGVRGDAASLFYHALAVLHAPRYRLEN